MLKRTAIIVGAAASLLVLSPLADANSGDSDGVNVRHDDHLDLLPVQACGKNLALAGVVVPVLSPQTKCDAPITEHPPTEP